jgi:transcriptional regulator with XRE-family HTH domain
MENDNIVKNRLKVIRNAHGLSQAQLADLVGMKQSMVNRVETHNANLTVQNAIKISMILGEPIENFFVDTYNTHLKQETRFDFLSLLKTWQLRDLKDAIKMELEKRKEEQLNEVEE